MKENVVSKSQRPEGPCFFQMCMKFIVDIEEKCTKLRESEIHGHMRMLTKLFYALEVDV